MFKNLQNNFVNQRENNDFAFIGVGVLAILIAIYCIFYTAGVGLGGVKPVKVAGVHVLPVPNAPISMDNNNKVIYTHGTPISNMELTDPLLGMSVKAIKIIRKIEMFQWAQSQESKKEKLKDSVDKETVVYTYRPIWSSDLIDSESFKDKVNYRNPLNMPVDGLKRKVQDVAVGDFHLSDELIDMISTEEQIDLSKLDIGDLQSRSKTKIFHDGQYIFSGDDVNHPVVGDLRISLYKIAPNEISIIAMQSDGKLHAIPLEDGKKIAYIETGRVSLKEMVSSNSGLIPWIFYFLGLVLIGFGVVAILMAVNRHLFQQVQVFVSALGLYVFAAVIAVLCWSMVMMFAFYFVKPIGAGVFFVIVALLVFLLYKIKAK